MLTRTGLRWLCLTALFIVAAWPPQQGRSLGITALNWAVDPSGSLPILPPQLGFGLSDDVQAVEIRDEMVRRYDELFTRDAVSRARLVLKVAEDPLPPVTERQLLLVMGVLAAFLALRGRAAR